MVLLLAMRRMTAIMTGAVRLARKPVRITPRDLKSGRISYCFGASISNRLEGRPVQFLYLLLKIKTKIIMKIIVPMPIYMS
jgi:hypothetical protein